MNNLSSTMKKRVLRLSRTLLKKNRKMSWREIQRESYPNVDHSTLHRIATSNGEWYPKDEAILRSLGIIKVRKTRTPASCDLFDMATDALRAALDNRQEMPPVDARVLKQFKKLGWLKAVRVR